MQQEREQAYITQGINILLLGGAANQAHGACDGELVTRLSRGRVHLLLLQGHVLGMVPEVTESAKLFRPVELVQQAVVTEHPVGVLVVLMGLTQKSSYTCHDT